MSNIGDEAGTDLSIDATTGGPEGAPAIGVGYYTRPDGDMELTHVSIGPPRGPKMVEVPVLLNSLHDEPPVGVLRIRADALPATPAFCFGIGIAPLDAEALKTRPYRGRYELREVVICHLAIDVRAE